ncbi:solute carrier family 22 member 7-like isoform X1 [Brienomyrus brachyistius]|uniref:solute carrier family 22 member 7-like isoform X1 n=1 Tax=Brienomyrus brachyistius TaxID=42636 RepID=UPI0020B275D3|nr:solute carrier family 22 member 7-like isoform X1 [Brienomyrus brachyistius]XP_048862626.1 solute carrier family 22 member 7-like isoform X1 [Brienomyrus brachyistius]
MKFENLLVEINGFGKYQILIFLLLVIPRFTLPFHFLLNIFIAAVPSHHCDIHVLDDGEVFENLTQEQRMIVSIPAEEDGSLGSCQMFPQPQFHLLHGVSNTTAEPAVPCQNGWVYDTSTFASTIATEWNLVCGRKGISKATATIFFMGVMIGSVVFGTLSDKFGRRPLLLVSYVSSVVFGLTSAFSSSYVMFAITRFFTGFALTGISIITIVLSVEWVDIEHRTFIGVVGSLCWSIGNMILAGIAYAVNDWRPLLITVTVPLVFSVITWWWIPESARWLIANGKVEKAHFYLQKCAEWNKKAEVIANIKSEALYSIVNVHDEDKSYTYLDLVRTPKMRRLALFTGIVWYGVASTYYGISLNVTGFGLNIYLTHFIYAAIEIPAKVCVYFCLDKLGRRYCQAGALILTGTCIAVNIFLPKDLWHFRTFIAVLGKGLSEASFTTVFLYTTELYPTVLRQNGVGYTNFMARMGGSVAPLILLLEDVWKPLPQIILCVVAMLSGFAAMLLRETHRTRLPETIEDIEQTRKLPVHVPVQEIDIPLKAIPREVS